MTRRRTPVPATAAFVEKVAAVCGTEGMARIAGRIFALLLVTPEPLSLDQLAEQLGASKASMSQDARALAQRGLLVRVTKRSDRRDYYRIPDDLFIRVMELRLERWKAFHDAVHDGRADLRIRSAEVQRRLEEFDAAYQFVTGALTRSIDEWHATRPGRRRLA